MGDGSGGGRSSSAGWSVVPGSGIDDYVGLTGGGSVVGGDRDDPVVDLIDSYSGSLRP